MGGEKEHEPAIEEPTAPPVEPVKDEAVAAPPAPEADQKDDAAS